MLSTKLRTFIIIFYYLIGSLLFSTPAVVADNYIDEVLRQLQGDSCNYVADFGGEYYLHFDGCYLVKKGDPWVKPQPSSAARCRYKGKSFWDYFKSTNESYENYRARCANAAAQCLGIFGSEASKAVPLIVSFLKERRGIYSPGEGLVDARRTLIRTLGCIGDRSALPYLEEIFPLHSASDPKSLYWPIQKAAARIKGIPEY